MVIVLMDLKMFGELLDSCSHEGNLHLWRTRVGFTTFVIIDDGLFLCCAHCHDNASPLYEAKKQFFDHRAYKPYHGRRVTRQ